MVRNLQKACKRNFHERQMEDYQVLVDEKQIKMTLEVLMPKRQPICSESLKKMIEE